MTLDKPDWLELAWKLSGSGMSKVRFAEVYADKIGKVPAGSHSAKAALDALSSIPEQGAGVKPLEWEWFNANLRYEGWETDTVVGRYSIASVDGKWQAWYDAEEKSKGIFDTPDEAKAAAQADYEARIRSALVAPSQPAAVGVTDEMVETIAKAIYEADPFYESGEWIDSFQVSPGGNLTWEQAKSRDAEMASVPCMLPVTKFAYDAAARVEAALRSTP